MDWPETARDVHADTLRLARLTEDLLLLARLDGQPLRRKPTDLAAVCAAVVARYSAARVPVQADRVQADRVQADAAGPCVVAGDPDALSRLLVNLLDNAVRHAASRVCVSVRGEDGWAVLVVSDDGPGSRPAMSNGPSAGSPAWTTRAAGPVRRAPAWAWPSCAPRPRPMAAQWCSATPRRACAP